MTARSRTSRLLLAAAAVLSVGAIAVVAPGPGSEPTVSAASGAGGEFHALPPERVLDTRPGRPGNQFDTVSPGKKQATAAGADFKVRLAGRGGLPAASEILAVVANVTVTNPELGGWLAVRPADQPKPPRDKQTSLVNFGKGQSVPNLALVGVDVNGDMTVTLRTEPSSRADVVVDVFGWISKSASTAGSGARLVTPTNLPGRLYDTRSTGGSFATGESRAVKVRGSSLVPNDGGITAVLANIGIDNRGSGNITYVTATPTKIPNGAKATTSNVNVVGGQVKTSLAIVPIGPDGNIYLRNYAGPARVLVDVLGYFKTAASGDTSDTGRIVPLQAPFRTLDTRKDVFGEVPLGTGMGEDWSFKNFAESVKLQDGRNPAQSALIGNLTGTGLGRLHSYVPASTYLTAYPAGQTRPNVANLNIAENEDVPNMSLLTYGSKGGDPYVVSMYNYYGDLHYVLDAYAIVLR